MASIVGQRAPHPGTPKHHPLATSAALALAVEALLFAGAGLWLIHPHLATPRRRPEPMVITLAPAAPKPAPKSAPAIPKPAPQPVVQPRRVAPVHPIRVAHAAPPKPQPKPIAPPPPPAPTPAPDIAPVTPAPAQTAAPTEPAPAPHPAPAPAPATGRPDTSFEASLRAAIQSALRYPESARMEGTTGRTLVAFVYRDSAVSDIRVVTSSGMGLLDHAAIGGVREAECPPPPHGMEGRSLPEQIWVDFKLDSAG
jgi:protein TonB